MEFILMNTDSAVLLFTYTYNSTLRNFPSFFCSFPLRLDLEIPPPFCIINTDSFIINTNEYI